MPQPYRGSSEVKIRWNPLSQRPDIASLIAQFLSAYAMGDAMFANILGKALKLDELIALDVYLALKAEGPAKHVFELLIRPRISAEAHKRLSDLRVEFKAFAEWRNDFAHGVYGIADDMPDDILIAKSADSARYFTALLKGQEAQGMRAQVYTKQEIEERLSQLVEVAENILRFGRGL
jgi:hypothetical protein